MSDHLLDVRSVPILVCVCSLCLLLIRRPDSRPYPFHFRIARLLCSLTALALVFHPPLPTHTLPSLLFLAAHVYPAVLSFLSVLFSTPIDAHLTASLVALCAPYATRDLWPLLTYDLTPADGYSPTLWIRAVLVLVAGVCIPLLVPRAGDRDADPDEPQPPESTCSVLSLLTYSFATPTIRAASRPSKPSPHGLDPDSTDPLPPLARADRAHVLRERARAYFDLRAGEKRKHVFVSLLRMFLSEYVSLALLLVLRALISLTAPISVNRLLKHIEHSPSSSSSSSGIRPIVWIAMLFLGPVANSAIHQWYLYITTRSLVRARAVLTMCVFERALSLRVAGASSTSMTTTAGATRAAATARPVVVRANTTTVGPDESEAVDVSGPGARARISTADRPPTVTPTRDLNERIATDADAGAIANLVTTDVDNVVAGRDFLIPLIYTPLQTALAVYFLYSLLGWSALVGTLAMLVVVPLPALVVRRMQVVQRRVMRATDVRVGGATEMLGALRMVKMFGWERRVEETMKGMRDVELKAVRAREVVSLANDVLNSAIPVIVMTTCFATFTLAMHQPLKPSTVFASMAVFEQLRAQMAQVSSRVPPIVRAKVSLDRLTGFLYNTETLRDGDGGQFQGSADTSVHARLVGVMRNVAFTWPDAPTLSSSRPPPSISTTSPDSDTEALPRPRRPFTLCIEDELSFVRDGFNIVVGPTGAGKTTLLLALLGEMRVEKLDGGEVVMGDGGATGDDGAVAYASQEPWVLNETVRDNILLGSPFDAERYDKVIDQCALRRDLALLSAGDKTEVGERGLTLSGGQRARIALARAVYSRAEVLLLDDVLAALDSHTARWIVDKCFKGDLIRGRTVVLVTHNVALVSPVADFVVALEGGRIVSRGSTVEAIAHSPTVAREALPVEDLSDEEEDAVMETDLQPKSEAVDGTLVVAEESQTGRVSWPAMSLFFSALGGGHNLLFWAAFLGLLVVGDLVSASQTYFVGWWSEQYRLKPADQVNVASYLGVFVSLLAVAVVARGISAIVFVFGAVRATKSIHERLMAAILGTTLHWLDVTPTSRVIARCTQDVRAMDNNVPQELRELVFMTSAMLIRLVAVVAVTPAFVLPAAILALAGAQCGNVYMRAQLAVKREMSIRRAPIIGHVAAASAAAVSIRAYGVQASLERELRQKIDQYTKTARTFFNLNRWVSTRMDALGGLFSAGLGAYLTYGPKNGLIPASSVGFSLTMAVGFSAMILTWVKLFNSFEIDTNSLERIHQYLGIEQESNPSGLKSPPAAWPTSGTLRVENLSAYYCTTGPRVLDNLTFEAASGERVGVVGRTGSGKSSLTLALLRCIYTDGRVYYDGVDTSKIPLDALRTSVTVIPQMPELLSGSLRENLDPFEERDDVELNTALRAAGFFALGKGGETDGVLDTRVVPGGANLSIGQRQIIALARALVRGSKLLILDEATSSVDHDTEEIIQGSVRHELGSDVTLLTIAHRLRTVMDSTRIMVLDAGRIVEFDTPRRLLDIEGGYFRTLVDESEDRDALMAMVKL